MERQLLVKEAETEYHQGEVIQWVGFYVGQEKFGVNVLHVQEIIRMNEITPVPGAPHYILGVINLRGNVVPILSTRACFNMDIVEATATTRIILIDMDKQVVGVVVDAVAEVVSLSQDMIEKAPVVESQHMAEFIYGVARRDDDLLILLDAHKFLVSVDWR